MANQTAQADFLANAVPPPLTNHDPGLGIARSLVGGATNLFGIAERRNLLPKT